MSFRHEIVNDEIQINLRFKVMGRIGYIELPAPVRMLDHPETLKKFIDDAIDKFVVANAMEDMALINGGN